MNKIRYQKKHSGWSDVGVLEEIYKKHILINGDWIPFDKLAKVETF